MDAETAIAIKTAPAWRPDAGDILTATVVKILRMETQYGAYPKVVLQNPADGSFLAWHAMHQTGLDALKKVKPSAGDTITIHYGGRIPSKSRKDSEGKPVQYHAWTIVTDNDTDEEFDLGSDDSPGF